MRMCESHWAALRQAIEDRGLAHLVEQSAEAAAAVLKRQLEGDMRVSDFDPLMAAWWSISETFLKGAGLAGLGDCCPLCEVDKQQRGLAADWIDGSTDDQLATARDLGLVPLAQ